MNTKGENNGISLFYKKRIDSFLENLAKAHTLDEDVIHKLRVDIKNIRSLLLLLEGFHVFDKNCSKLLKQVQKVFKTTGKLRTIQVYYALLDEMGQEKFDSAEIKEALAEGKEEVAKKIQLSLSKFNQEKFNARLDKLYAELNEVNVDDLRENADRIIESEIDVIYKLWASSRGEEYYHDIRKFFKIIKALLLLLLSIEENKDLQDNYEIVNDTEQILGKWHDRDVFAKRLSQVQASISKGELNPQFRSIKNLNKNEMSSLAKDFNKQMRTHFIKR